MGEPVRVYKRDHAGRPAWQYGGEIVAVGPRAIELTAYFDIDDRDDGYFLWQRGDFMHEWYFSDRWYNVYRIHDRAGRAVRGWYCNISRPAQFGLADGVRTITWDDLELDVFVHPDGRAVELDHDAYAALPLPAHERAAVAAALAELHTAAAERRGLFAHP
jgi:hypothetical protein